MSANTDTLTDNFATQAANKISWKGLAFIGIAAACGAAAFFPGFFGINVLAEGFFGSTIQQSLLGMGAISLGGYVASNYMDEQKKDNDDGFFNWNALGLGFLGGMIITGITNVLLDMMFGFPLAHYSLIGKDITGWSSEWLLPIIDGFAIDFLGYEAPEAPISSDGALPEMPADIKNPNNVIPESGVDAYTLD